MLRVARGSNPLPSTTTNGTERQKMWGGKGMGWPSGGRRSL